MNKQPDIDFVKNLCEAIPAGIDRFKKPLYNGEKVHSFFPDV